MKSESGFRFAIASQPFDFKKAMSKVACILFCYRKAAVKKALHLKANIKA